MLLKSKKLSQSVKAKIEQEKTAAIEMLRGVPGVDGCNGMNGKDGIDGKDGKDGIDGKAGQDGEMGPRGPQGPKGDKGDKGDPGVSGEAGHDGIGIQNVRIVRNDLIITFTTGEERNVGRVVGERGPMGPQGYSGGVFGNTTENITNITEEVLSPEDSANLAAIASTVNHQLNEQRNQQEKLNKKMNKILLHLGEMTDEEFTELDLEEEDIL